MTSDEPRISLMVVDLGVPSVDCVAACDGLVVRPCYWYLILSLEDGEEAWNQERWFDQNLVQTVGGDTIHH